MGRAAKSSSWPVGACPDRQPMEDSRSSTSGTSQVRTGVGGGWLKRENRCIVPATSFCEYEDTKPRKTPTWFALNDDRPLFAFRRALDPLDRCPRAREARPSWGEHQLFGFLTTTANAIGALIRPKATPVILKTPDGVDVWLSAETKDALELQRPLPDGALKIVARGERSDGKDLALDLADSGSAS